MHLFETSRSLIVLFLLINTSFSNAMRVDSTYLEIGYRQYKEAKYDSAILNLEKAEKELANTNESQDYAYSQLYLGKCHGALARYQKAQQYFDKGLKFSLKALGRHNDATIRLYEAIDYNFGAQSKYDKALIHGIEALNIKKEMHGEKHPSLLTSYNSIAFNVRSLGHYDSALTWYNNALDLSKEVYDNYEMEGSTSRTLYGIGWLYAAFGEFPKAMNYFKHAYHVSANVYGKDHPTTAQKIKMLGWCSMQLGDYSQALEYSHKTAAIRKKKLGENHPNMATTYHDLGKTYMLLGEFDKAIAYQERGNAIWSAKFGSDNNQMPNFHNNLGRSYSSKGNFDRALEEFEKAHKIALKVLGEDHVELANTFQLMADVYEHKKEYSRQYEFLKKALKISVNYYDENHTNAAMIHRKLGKYFATLNENDKVLEHYGKALHIFHNKYQAKHPMIAQTLSDMGDHYYAIEQEDSALYYYQASLINLSKTFNNKQVHTNPFYDDIQWGPQALKTLDKKAKVLASANGDLKRLRLSLDTYQVAIDLIDKIKKQYIRESSKEDLYKGARNTFQGAIGICCQIYQNTQDDAYLEKAFQYSEKSKSMLLFEVLNASKAKEYGGVPDSLISRETTLKMEVSLYEDRLFKALQKGDTDKINSLKQSLFHAQNSYEELVRQLEKSNPDYYDLKYANTNVTVKDIQNHLISKRSALVEFFIGDSTIYVFTLSKDNYYLTEEKMPKDFNNLIYDYRKATADYNFIINSSEEADLLYLKSAKRLYDILLKESLVHLREKKTDQLIIIPDAILWHINFNTLLSTVPEVQSKTNYKALSYLINSYSTSVAYSASILASKTAQTKRRTEFVGFAPKYDGAILAEEDTLEHQMLSLLVRAGELPLPGAQSEVLSVTEIMGGTSFLGDVATEANFKKLVTGFDIVHLAMHSLLNDHNPAYSELIFIPDSIDDGFLTVSEIYNLKLNADLVVLSACNSGFGKIQQGEGPISLSRAFNYAGCPSVVMSMWKIPDDPTKQIMVEFYKHLKEGENKDVALRKAQLEYLKTTSDPLYQHPFFWGSFVTTGNIEPVMRKSTNWLYYLIISLSIIFVAVAVRKYRS